MTTDFLRQALMKSQPGGAKLENIARRTPTCMVKGAKWWAMNCCIMTTLDPWKSHFATVPHAALVAAGPPELVQWFTDASAAVGNAPGNIYQSCMGEFLADRPPWEDPEMSKLHMEQWSVDMRKQNLLELLAAIKADQAITPPTLNPPAGNA